MRKRTVVRWCAAFALSEIAKHNSEVRSNLVLQMDEIVRKEKNNGVRNVYLKAMKALSK